MSKKDHRAEVFALCEVVRSVFRGFQGKPVPAHALEALTTVEAWLRGDDIDEEALQKAADLSHEDGVAYAQREKDRAIGWLRTAAGNLAWFAKKDRGWEKADQSILDAALNALSSLGADVEKADLELKALRVAALARAPDAPGETKKSKAKKQEPIDLSAHIGAKANKYLAKLKPVFEEKSRCSEAELVALLSEKGYTAHAAVIAYDALYGGLVTADAPGEEGDDWIFGACACIKSGAHSNPRGEKDSWVPIAYSPIDEIFFMDERGVVWSIDTIGDTQHRRYADSGGAMMKQLFTATNSETR